MSFCSAKRLSKVAVLYLAVLQFSCSNPNDAEKEGKRAVVVTAADLADYRTWEAVDTARGPDPSQQLFGFHSEADSNIYRIVYRKPTGVVRDSMSGQYPLGTIYLKEIRRRTNGVPDSLGTGEFTVMAKVGGSYFPESNGWEYFYSSAGTAGIKPQGEKTSNFCFKCHSAAVGTYGADLIFKH